MKQRLSNIYRLGIKELWSLMRDPAMLILIFYSFTVAIYSAATVMPETLNKVPIAIIDEDNSQLSNRIISGFYPPQFITYLASSPKEVDHGMDAGRFTFSLTIPVGFQRDVLSGKSPAIQLNVDATRMSQAFSGSGHVQKIVMTEVTEFVMRHRTIASIPIELNPRIRFNSSLNQSWFGSIMEIINQITMLSIILSGAALIREREHGTIEHLLVMPLKPHEIMLAKVWSTGMIVLIVTALSLTLIVRGLLHVPIEGSIPLFLFCVALHLFATTSMGIFMATISRSMPQFGLLLIMTLLPLEMLSGGMTPRESMPDFAQFLMLAAPTTHFTAASQAILYRGAGFDIVWPQMLAIFIIGSAFFLLALGRFRKTLSQMA